MVDQVKLLGLLGHLNPWALRTAALFATCCKYKDCSVILDVMFVSKTLSYFESGAGLKTPELVRNWRIY